MVGRLEGTVTAEKTRSWYNCSDIVAIATGVGVLEIVSTAA